MPPGLSPSQCSLHLILSNGEQLVSVNRPLDVSLYGLAFRRDGEWQAHSASSALNLNEIKDVPARIVVPDKEWDWELYAGEKSLRPAPFDSSLLPPCIGLGEALTLRCSLRLPHLILAPQIVSNGEIAEVWFGERSRTLSVGLRSITFAPTQEYQLVWWDFNGELFFQGLNNGGTEDGRMWWTACYPDGATRPRAIALAYGATGQHKTWMGLWHVDDWTEHLDFSSPVAVYNTQRRLHWFRLPVLSENGCTALRDSARFDLEQTVKAWEARDPFKKILKLSDDRRKVVDLVLPLLKNASK